MRFAFADPPYIGQAAKHYSTEPTYAGEVDHADLIDRMIQEYDGWALCASSPSLPYILSLCAAFTEDIHIGAWVKPFASFKPNVNPSYSWEPVIFDNCRKRDRSEPTVKDFHSEPITLRKGLAGAKPEGFCWWVLDMLGVRAEDQVGDIFPGTGVMCRVVERRRQWLEGRVLYEPEKLPLEALL